MSEDTDIRLSAQRALWGAVPRSLRAFSAEVVGQTVFLRSVFDETITEDDKFLLSAAGSEIIADYPSSFSISEEFLTVPLSCELQHLKLLIYLRHEPQQAVQRDGPASGGSAR